MNSELELHAKTLRTSLSSNKIEAVRLSGTRRVRTFFPNRLRRGESSRQPAIKSPSLSSLHGEYRLMTQLSVSKWIDMQSDESASIRLSSSLIGYSVINQYQVSFPVSSGPNKYQAGTAFTKNRDLHAVCSTGWLSIHLSGKLNRSRYFLRLKG